MKAIKRIKLCLISVFTVIFASTLCAFFTFNANAAKADAATDDVFVMDDGGLTLRLIGGAGIRFKVKMNESVKTQIDNNETTLNFLVAPRAVFDAAKDFNAIVTAATSATGSKVPAKIMVADKGKIYSGDDGFYYANVVISNVLEQNRTLDMCALAYYVKDGANTFATVNYENVRGNLYGVVNATALMNAEYAKSVFASEELSWFGTANYPVNVETNEQAETLKAAQDGGTDLSLKVILAKSTVTVPAGMESVIKTVSETNLDGTTEIVLASAESYAANVGTIDGTVVKATIGGKVVSFADGNVTLNADFKARLVKHGEQTLTLTVEKNGQYTNVNKNLLIVTKEITSFDELKAAVKLDKNFVKYGYYRLKQNLTTDGNMSCGSNDSIGGKNTQVWRYDGQYGFRGTLDGNNLSMTARWNGMGIFGVLGRGAVIKNITLVHSKYEATQMILGYTMVGSTLNNVTVNVSGNGTETIPAGGVGGLLTAITSYDSNLESVTINAANTAIDTLFGNGKYYGYPVANPEKNTFSNCTVTVKSLFALSCDGGDANKAWFYTNEITGLTIIVPRAAETATDKIIVGQAYGYSFADIAEITAIKLGNSDFTAYTFADGTLTINADAFGPSDTGSKTFVVTAKNEKGYVMNFNLNVTIEFVATPVALEGNREIVLSSGNNFSVDLGDYTNATVLAATLGGETVTYSGGTLTVTDEFKANTQKHGNQTLSVIVQKDGTYYNVTTNVLVVTKTISTIDELTAVTTAGTDNVVYGYYKLTQNVGSSEAWINVQNNGNWMNPDGSVGFRGTLDGAGFAVDGQFATHGLFGIIGNGAVVKNITFNVYYYQNGRQTLARSITGATIENITINIKSVHGTLDATAEGGVITGLMSHTTHYKDVTINAEGKDLDTLFGKSYGNYKTEKANTFENCVVNAKSLAGLVHSNEVISAAGIDGLTIPQ